MRIGLGTSGTLKYQHLNHRGAKKRKEEQEIKNLFEKHNERKLPPSGERNRHTSPGRSESPKQVGPKEAHTKAHHNYITHD